MYVDNDISAYSGKLRPAYERMLDDIRVGAIDAVLVYNLDRLTRRPAEFEDFNAVLRDAGVASVRFVTGDMDLGTDDGLLIGRIQAAVAADESAKKRRRVKRKLLQVAEEGRPHGGSVRPFGFEDDRTTHRVEEADAIRTIAARYLAGESIQLPIDCCDTKPTDTDRHHLAHVAVYRLLTSPRIPPACCPSGRSHRPGLWLPIISPTDHDRLLAKLAQKAATGRRPPRRYLLSGLLRCGRCEKPLYSAARKTTRRYVCSSSSGHDGCGGITVVAAPVEELLADAVLLRLDNPGLADALAGIHRDDADLADLSARLDDDRAAGRARRHLRQQRHHRQ